MDSQEAAFAGARTFATTHWTVVTAAGNRGSPRAAAALEELCRTYWHPVYSYIRRNGWSAEDAQDLTQDFFCRLVHKNSLEALDRSKGSFRALLLASVNHLLANEWDKARALKRGGGREIISLDAEEAEGRFIQEPARNESPEKAFDRGWAVTLLDRAFAQLRDECAAAGKLAQFDALKVYLSDVAAAGDYAALAPSLGLDAGGVAVAVHRLRQRYRELVRNEIAHTVTTESELNAEMRHLFSALD